MGLGANSSLIKPTPLERSKNMKKDSFIIYDEYYEMIRELSTADKGLLFTALFEYQISGIEIDLPQMARIIFKFIKKRMDYNEERYLETCQKRKEAGALGGKVRSEKQMQANGSQSKQMLPNAISEKQMQANGSQSKQMLPNAISEKQMQANQADMDTDTDIDIKKETNKEKNVGELVKGVAKTLRIGNSKVVKVKINDSFQFSLDDPDVKPYVRAYGEGIVRDVERWLIRHKYGETVDLPFICRQFNKFAERQGIST